MGDKAHIHMAQEKVKGYKESFDKISNATNIDDIDILVNTFISSEQENFKLFNQVNKMGNEIERFEEQISNTQKEIELINGGDVENDADNTEKAEKDILTEAANGGNTNQRQIILKDLKNKIKNTELKTSEYKNKYQESLKTMSSLKDGISLILNKIGINDNNKAMMDMIKNTGVTESNVMEILGVIEQKTNELITNYLAVSSSTTATTENVKDNVISTTTDKNNKDNNNKQLDDKQAEAASLGIGIGAASLQPLVATPASIFDDFSDEDDDNNDDDNNQPFSQDQIHHNNNIKQK